jgi:hypothetical protein
VDGIVHYRGAASKAKACFTSIHGNARKINKAVVNKGGDVKSMRVLTPSYQNRGKAKTQLSNKMPTTNESLRSLAPLASGTEISAIMPIIGA